MTSYRSRTRWGTAALNLRRLIWPDVTVSLPPAGVRFDYDVAVPVRDGTTLRANVFRPEDDLPHPVLLCAATYGKDQMPENSRSGRAIPLQYRLASNDASMRFSAWTALEAPDPAFWVPRGYVLVTLDLRGWGHSNGQPQTFSPSEGDDVHDAIEWAAGQSWSNGRVGMTGVSYLAISQWNAAATRPPHLAAINPWEGFVDAYTDFAYPGGVREDGFLRVWSLWQRRMRPSSNSFRRAQLDHPLRNAWWTDRAPAIEGIDVPALVCGSFSDHSLHSAGSFAGFARLGSTQKWLYTHRAPKWSTYYGADALAAQTRFFDHFLRGEDTGIEAEPAVRVEIRDVRTEVAQVRGATTWPPADVVARRLHLDAATGTLSSSAPITEGSRAVPRGGLRFRWSVETRTDVVGPIRLQVTISTERDDVTLFAAVRKFRGGREVVFEGSYGFTEDLVTRGWLRASHRVTDPARATPWTACHPHELTQPLVPGEPTALDLTLLPSATRFEPGDELVLEVRDRWFFPADPVFGQFPAVYAHTPRQRWRVHTGGTHTGQLTLPDWPDTTARP